MSLSFHTLIIESISIFTIVMVEPSALVCRNNIIRMGTFGSLTANKYAMHKVRDWEPAFRKKTFILFTHI